MREITGEATVIVTPYIIPIARDGENGARAIASRDIKTAIEAVSDSSQFVGFKLMNVYEAVVKPDGGDADITFSKRDDFSKIYRFANRTISREEFASNAVYADARPLYDYHLQNDSEAVLYETPKGYVEILSQFNSRAPKDHILIDKEGQQVWPLRSARVTPAPRL